MCILNDLEDHKHHDHHPIYVYQMLGYERPHLIKECAVAVSRFVHISVDNFLSDLS